MKEIKKSMPSHENAVWQDIAEQMNERAFNQGLEPTLDKDSAYKHAQKPREKKMENSSTQTLNKNKEMSFASRDPAELKTQYEKNLAYFSNSKIAKSPEEAEAMAMIKMVKPELKDAQEIRHFMGDALESLNKAGTLDSLKHNVTTTASQLSSMLKTGINRLMGDESSNFGLQLDALKTTVDSMAQIHSEGLGQRMQRGKLGKISSMAEEFENESSIKNVNTNKKTI